MLYPWSILEFANLSLQSEDCQTVLNVVKASINVSNVSYKSCTLL